jgi:hypothetical protein
MLIWRILLGWGLLLLVCFPTPKTAKVGLIVSGANNGHNGTGGLVSAYLSGLMKERTG